MRNILIVGAAIGSMGFLIVIGVSIRLIIGEYGFAAGFAAVACVAIASVCIGFLVDMNRAQERRRLERIEMLHGIDLTAEKRALDI